MPKISGVIITFNEERNIEKCILSMQEVVDEVMVVDSFSSDKTPEICKKLGVNFIQHPFAGHIEQKNFAMDQAAFDHVLSLDADERLSDEMRSSVMAVKQNWESDVDGYVFNRFNNYCGAWLRHSWYPDKKLRLWDRRKGRWGGTNPHDKVLVNGKTKKLKGDILHYAYDNLEEHYEQMKKFAVIAAHAKFKQGKRTNFAQVIFSPAYKFFRKYFLRLGFLDGYYGFIFSGLTAYLNFMKYLRLWELGRNEK